MAKLKFQTQIKDIEKINPLFSKCKVYICYSDLNRNNSDIQKTVFEDAIHTLYGCPILGEFNKKKDDFMDHGGKVEKNENGEYQYVCTTMPYGFVPESSEVKWENVDGKEYLTCTGYLWTSRYPEALKAIEEGRPQSMEIDEVVGEFDSQGCYVVSSFVFSGLTILGEDVEPCFEDAKIVAYSLDKDQFTKEFNLMVNELKDSLYGNLDFQFKNNKEVEDVIKSKKDFASKFSLTVNQLYDEIGRALSESKYKTTNWQDEEVEVNRYYLRDFDDSFIYAVDRMQDYIDVKLSYSLNGDNVVIDFESIKRVKYVPTDWEKGTSLTDDDLASVNITAAIEKEFKASVQQLKESYQKQFDEKNDAYIKLNGKWRDLSREMAKKDEIIQSLQQFKKQVEEAERKEKVEATFKKFAQVLSKDDMDELRNKESTFGTFEEFEREVKSFACDKLISSSRSTLEFSRMSLLKEEDNTKSDDKSVWKRLENKQK